MLNSETEVGVVGAGAMGSEIAFVFALAGLRVLIHDSHDDKLESLIKGSRTFTRRASNAASTRLRASIARSKR